MTLVYGTETHSINQKGGKGMFFHAAPAFVRHFVMSFMHLNYDLVLPKLISHNYSKNKLYWEKNQKTIYIYLFVSFSLFCYGDNKAN